MKIWRRGQPAARRRASPSSWPPDLAQVEAALLEEGYPEEVVGELVAWQTSDYEISEMESLINARQEVLALRGYPPGIAQALAEVEVAIGDPWGRAMARPSEAWIVDLRRLRKQLQDFS